MKKNENITERTLRLALSSMSRGTGGGLALKIKIKTYLGGWVFFFGTTNHFGTKAALKYFFFLKRSAGGFRMKSGVTLGSLDERFERQHVRRRTSVVMS